MARAAAEYAVAAEFEDSVNDTTGIADAGQRVSVNSNAGEPIRNTEKLFVPEECDDCRSLIDERASFFELWVNDSTRAPN